MSAGQELEAEQNDQNAKITENHVNSAQALALALSNAARITKLEKATAPPPVDPPPIDPPPIDPPPVDPPVGDRRFACNICYKTEKDWSPDKPSHPNYQNIISRFNGFRFMDHWGVNDDLNSGGGMTQADRDRLDWEIDTCNRHDAAMYLCFRFYDSGDTIRYKAGRVRDRLKPSLVRYYEWANEPWVGSTAVCREIVRLAGPVWDSGQNKYRAAHIGDSVYHGVWAAYASGAFSVAKQTDPSGVTVLGCITANPWVTGKVEDKLTTKPDAHGLTFYFGSGLGGTPDPNTTVEQILESANNKITTKEIPRIQKHAEYSKSIGRRIVGYEGFSHFTIDPNQHTSHKKVWQNMNHANRDPRIIPLIERVVRAAEDAGYERLFIFNLATIYDQWGSWGLVESLDNLDTVKYKYAAGLP